MAGLRKRWKEYDVIRPEDLNAITDEIKRIKKWMLFASLAWTGAMGSLALLVLFT